MSDLHASSSGKSRLVRDNARDGVGKGFGYVYGRSPAFLQCIYEFVDDEGVGVAVPAVHPEWFGQHVSFIPVFLYEWFLAFLLVSVPRSVFRRTISAEY